MIRQTLTHIIIIITIHAFGIIPDVSIVSKENHRINRQQQLGVFPSTKMGIWGLWDVVLTVWFWETCFLS